MKALRFETAFKKDLKRITKRGYDRAKLDALVVLLRQEQPLPPARRDHSLKGEWHHYRECHLEPDWLLIYRTTDDEVLLARTGTHADLFNK
jgi:mRNA interferase YafQ